MSKAERLRRQRISRSLRKHWREVKASQARERAAAIEAPTAPRASLLDWIGEQITRAERFVRGVQWTAEPGTQNAAFLLRSNEPDLASRFGRNESVTITLHLVKFGQDRSAPPGEKRTEVTFNTGDSEEAFWKNYYDAVRNVTESAAARAKSGEDRGEYEYEQVYDYDTDEYYDYEPPDAGEVGYESFGVFVAGLA